MHFLAVKNEMRSLLLCRLCGRPPPSRSLSRRAPPPAVHYRFPLFVHRLRPFVSSDTPYSTATRMTEHCARRPYTVFVEGNVGSGKTTFLEQFTDCPNVCLAKEPVHKWQDVRGHNFLGLMYEDPKRWSFAFQSIVQRTMLELHQKRPAEGQNIKIMERSIFSARTDPEVAYQRIKTRNRSEEKDVPFEYIKNLHELHDKWLNVHKTDVPKNIPVVIVDANQSMELVRKQFNGIRDLITKNASALVEPIDHLTNPNISETGKIINDIQLNLSPNCKLIADSTIIPAQRV